MPNIAIIWDFDGTLTPICSTSHVIETFTGKEAKEFWSFVKGIKKSQSKEEYKNVLGTDAPIWMAYLARVAYEEKIPLNSDFFKGIAPYIPLFPNVKPFLRSIKSIAYEQDFVSSQIQIHHFIVSAGLKDLISLCFPSDLIKWVFGCKYRVIKDEEGKPESIPVYCMDETIKTRSIFEISKGCFLPNAKHSVNERIQKSDLWVPFENTMYVGDSDTDVPAFALVRDRGGMSIMIHDPSKNKSDVIERMKHDKRVDLIAPTDFSETGELFSFIKARCIQIRQRYEAQTPVKS
jgi:2-hydroxy-3-keto-5-methylthiopentenyl-1-phosphate phosphatase